MGYCWLRGTVPTLSCPSDSRISLRTSLRAKAECETSTSLRPFQTRELLPFLGPRRQVQRHSPGRPTDELYTKHCLETLLGKGAPTYRNLGHLPNETAENDAVPWECTISFSRTTVLSMPPPDYCGTAEYRI